MRENKSMYPKTLEKFNNYEYKDYERLRLGAEIFDAAPDFSKPAYFSKTACAGKIKFYKKPSWLARFFN